MAKGKNINRGGFSLNRKGTVQYSSVSSARHSESCLPQPMGRTWRCVRSCTGTCNSPRQGSGCQQKADRSRNLSHWQYLHSSLLSPTFSHARSCILGWSVSPRAVCRSPLSACAWFPNTRSISWSVCSHAGNVWILMYDAYICNLCWIIGNFKDFQIIYKTKVWANWIISWCSPVQKEGISPKWWHCMNCLENMIAY